ncbi:hypothetical protein M409DRAFT_29652 [Zasmidium cellare ATCC 36951]|uniref:PH domain-like protein n=1 Tax=Zasmidium cellare ATCC 36951 TaxID=1080233 RepID=A0A6A6C1Y2_ZASCE|nr:uncharacterized protein M409DRAFT_29652 [Zasmidium cellare ATCC 36951]KAF2159842.1 hypothetical protein M409DRAFT_29652 [Zasmidium cellare ATCC 36951]
MTVFVKIDFDADDNTQNPLPPDPGSSTQHPSTKMPKKKSKAAQTQPIISDYETDTYNTDQNVAPPVQQLSNAQLNHLVLQRWSPELQTILAISPFAVLYNFNPETAAWEKSDLQGSLFVCQLQDPLRPRYEVMILNRKNPENLHLEITSSENIEVTDEFVIVHIEGGEGQTVGLWMFSDEETPAENRLEAIAKKIMECAVQAETYNHLASDGEGYQGQEEYGTDGVMESQYYTEQQQQPPAGATHGQSIDLATLFANRVQQPAEQAQPNVLLDLFKNAKKG